MKPRPAKPSSIIAQVEGSRTAVIGGRASAYFRALSPGANASSLTATACRSGSRPALAPSNSAVRRRACCRTYRTPPGGRGTGLRFRPDSSIRQSAQCDGKRHSGTTRSSSERQDRACCRASSAARRGVSASGPSVQVSKPPYHRVFGVRDFGDQLIEHRLAECVEDFRHYHERVLPADDVLAVVGIQTANRVGVVGVLF
jgi:hypothetical protein